MDKICVELDIYEYNIIMSCLRDRVRGEIPVIKTSDAFKIVAAQLIKNLEIQTESQI